MDFYLLRQNRSMSPVIHSVGGVLKRQYFTRELLYQSALTEKYCYIEISLYNYHVKWVICLPAAPAFSSLEPSILNC